jgi:hypothetical protein
MAWAWIAAWIVGATATGCIHATRTEVRDEARLPVEFESEAAGRIFYETLSKRPPQQEGEEQVTRVTLPVVFSDERRVVKGPNQGFNRAVRECDANGDRRITEVEAKVWAGRGKE